jgi:hypothetical protein
MWKGKKDKKGDTSEVAFAFPAAIENLARIWGNSLWYSDSKMRWF